MFLANGISSQLQAMPAPMPLQGQPSPIPGLQTVHTCIPHSSYLQGFERCVRRSLLGCKRGARLLCSRCQSFLRLLALLLHASGKRLLQHFANGRGMGHGKEWCRNWRCRSHRYADRAPAMQRGLLRQQPFAIAAVSRARSSSDSTHYTVCSEAESTTCMLSHLHSAEAFAHLLLEGAKLLASFLLQRLHHRRGLVQLCLGFLLAAQGGVRKSGSEKRADERRRLPVCKAKCQVFSETLLL